MNEFDKIRMEVEKRLPKEKQVTIDCSTVSIDTLFRLKNYYDISYGKDTLMTFKKRS